MDWDGDEVVREFQRKQDAEGAGDGDESDDSQQGLNIEKLKLKSDSLTDKQKSLLSKVEGLRRKVVKLGTKNNKKTDPDEVNVAATGKLKKQLEATEEKLKTSLKSTRENANNSNSDLSDSDEERVKMKDSDDEFDDFFDRTNKEKVILPGQPTDSD